MGASSITFVVEPLNELVDHPSYYLVKSTEAFDVIKQVGCRDVKVLFDIYHQQISEGNLLNHILPNIDHFHTDGNPDRNGLQCGEINYQQLFNAIKQTNFTGSVGLEY